MEKNRKILDRTFSEICSLLEELAFSASEIDQPPPETGLDHTFEPYEIKFSINKPQDVADAMIELLFGAQVLEREKGKRGPKGFEEQDRELVIQARAMKDEMGIALEKALFLMAPQARRRGADTSDESIVSRLIDVHQKMQREEKIAQNTAEKYEPIFDASFAYDVVSIDYSLMSSWLHRHKGHLIRYLK